MAVDHVSQSALYIQLLFFLIRNDLHYLCGEVHEMRAGVLALSHDIMN